MIAISFGPDTNDDMRRRLRPAFDRFIEVRELNDRDAARQLRELEVDIAVDLKGYTRDARAGILAYRPAPVQVSYLGFPATMGASFMDYILADRYVIPEGEEPFYAEQVVRLPHCYQVTDDRRPIAESTLSRRDAGLPEQGFVFCCLNNCYKISPPLFETWMRLLRAVPGSVLWLLDGGATAVDNLRREAAARGVDPQRLAFAGKLPQAEHLARYRLADLFLDTLPYNAHTTASDALWAGLPVVTCTGSTFAGRVATSILHAIGLPDLVAPSLEQYETLALDLATSPARLAEVRERVARNRLAQPLLDTDGFRRAIEAAYRTMWERQQRGQPPVAFDVPAA
jgi:predicted O-linked N-acetylglucosamine transferase (SPINDLY family)